MVKYVVRLNTEERVQLLVLVPTGQAAAVTRLHARILLKADGDANERPWTDAEIADALDTSPSTVHRVRQAWVEQGLAAVLSRKPPPGRPYRKRDGAQEAPLMAVAWSAPPEGRVRWPLKLLAKQLVALDIVDTISPECVRTTRKKTSSNPGASSTG